MHRRLAMVLGIATVVGLLASFFVYRVISQLTARAREQPTEQIVVAAVNLGLAETVSSRHVKLQPWPKNSVPAGAIRSLAEAEGRVVRSSIVPGEPLLEAKLAPQLSGRGGIMPMLIPEGQRGVTIKVDEAIRESGFVLPNSRVDVLVSMFKEHGSQVRVSKVILQDVLVLAAGQTVELRDNKPVTVTTVTLSLTPEQVERLSLAQSEGKLTLATRNLRDNRVVDTPGATAATLLGHSTPAASERAPSASPRRPRSAPYVSTTRLSPRSLEIHTISVLRAGQLSQHTFVRKEDTQWVEQKK